ncbi:MAG: hypothetical protein SNJ71_03770, partial [Bacteroidales bacterium]
MIYSTLQEILEIDSSRATADMAIAFAGNNPETFKEAMELALHAPYPVSMRAARIVENISALYPHLVKPHIQTIIEHCNPSST